MRSKNVRAHLLLLYTTLLLFFVALLIYHLSPLLRAHLGEWKLKKCAKNEYYVPTQQKCRLQSSVRRQQSLCQLQPFAFPCQQQLCAASHANPFAGGPCNWATAPLVPFMASASYFLQCTPSLTGYCIHRITALSLLKIYF